MYVEVQKWRKYGGLPLPVFQIPKEKSFQTELSAVSVKGKCTSKSKYVWKKTDICEKADICTQRILVQTWSKSVEK